jgi:hypothetical protein
MQDRSLAQRVDLIRRRRNSDPEQAAADAIVVLRELHGGGGPTGPYGELHAIRARGVALVALQLGADRYGRRLARAEREPNPTRRQALEELAVRERAWWSAAARRFQISHTQARAWGEPALPDVLAALGLEPVGAPR